jgi:outer membrane protein, multidrug efflux system
VQNAFKDVHDAMNSVETGRDLATTAATRLGALRETMRLADLRYNAGYTSYLEVLNAQRDLAQAESGLVDAQRNQLNAVVSLHRALGGGWDGAGAKQD